MLVCPKQIAGSLKLLIAMVSGACLTVTNLFHRYSENGTPPKDLQIQSSPSGKPWLVSEEGQGSSGGQLHFNVTHTDRLLGKHPSDQSTLIRVASTI